MYTFCLFILWLFRLSIHGSWWKGLTGLDRRVAAALKYWTRIFRIPIHGFLHGSSYFYFMQICCQHLHGGRYNCANLKDRGKSRILKDWSRLWQESPTVAVGAQSLWQNPSEIHPETPKTPLWAPLQLSTGQLSMSQVTNLSNERILTSRPGQTRQT